MLTHRLPFPPDKGERIRAYHWLRILSAEHDVDLLTLTDCGVDPAHKQALEKLANHLWIVPLDRQRAFWRFVKALLTGRSLTEAYFTPPEFARAAQRLLAGGNSCYDVCLAICSSTGTYLLNTQPLRRVVVDLIDADSAKWSAYAERARGLRRWMYRRESLKVAALERRLAHTAHLIAAVSARECRILESLAPRCNTVVIPNGVDAEYFKPQSNRSGIDGLAFVGQMNYFPNEDAVAWFAEHVWPMISAHHPQLRWHIVGRHPTKAIQKLDQLPNVVVTGEVHDVRPYLNSAISIAPLRIGCGVQNKVLEAMAAARPVVASPAAARGLEVRPQQELLIADTPNEWLAAIELLLANPDLAHQLGARARRTAIQRFSWDRIGQLMLTCLGGKTTNPSQPHRPIMELETISSQ